jgi:pyruvyltransferase
MARRDNISVYWWNEEPNFGDSMTPILLARLFNVDVTWAPLENACLTAAGSIIQWITPVRRDPSNPIHVWGSGYIFPDEPAPTDGTVTYHAVRGPESAKLSGLPHETVYGDPGLLASRVFSQRRGGGDRIGIVPHMDHRTNPVVSHLAESNELVVIDVTSDPESVISLISSCNFIFSSSLHGLVIADSFRIPNLWVNASPDPFGGRWKFNDYYGIFGFEMEPVPLTANLDVRSYVDSVTDSYTRPGLDDISDALFGAFPC